MLTVRLNDITAIALYTDHTGNERHLRWRERKKESKCVCGECRGLAKSFYHWTAASAPLASKSRGGGGG